MSSGSSPPAPDYAGAARATADSSEQVNAAQTYANRPNVSTPWGTQTWQQSQTIDPATGKPVTVWNQNIQLTPQQQQALDAQTNIANARSNAAMAMLPGVMQGFGLQQLPQQQRVVQPPQGQMTGTDRSIPVVDERRTAQGNPGTGAGTGAGTAAAGAASSFYGGGNALGLLAGAGGGVANPAGSGTAAPPPFSYGDGSVPAPAYGTNLKADRDYWGVTAVADPVSPITRNTQQGNGAGGYAEAVPMARSGGIDPNYWRAAGQGAALGFQAPLQQQRQQALETQLSNQGVTRGSQAWTNEMRTLQDQNARDNLQAFGAGQSEANMLFNQALSSDNQSFNQGLQYSNQAFGQNLASQNFNQTLRQQQIAEMLQARSQPLNEMNALLSGQQIGMPQMPGASNAGRAQGADLVGAASNAYGAQLNASNAQNAANASNTSAAAGLASAAAMAYMMYSDARLKKDVELLFTLPNGINVYKYHFIGRPGMEIGVLAQEVQKILPDAVAADEKGYLKVNYDMVLS